MLGVVLFLLTLALSFTGYLLPWDQLAFWAITVGTSIAGYAPLVGQKLKFMFLGGHVVGESALIRFYVLHVIVLPLAAIVLIAVHLWRVRKDGGLARPDEPQTTQEELAPAQLPLTKTYGLMELARGTTPAVGINPDDEVFTWPHLVFREILLFLATRRRPAGAGHLLERAAGANRQPGASAQSGQGAVVFPGACRNWSPTRPFGAGWSCRRCWSRLWWRCPMWTANARALGCGSPANAKWPSLCSRSA